MKIIAAICIGLATGAGALTTSAQQSGSLVTTLPNDVPLEFVRIAPGEFMMDVRPATLRVRTTKSPRIACESRVDSKWAGMK